MHEKSEQSDMMRSNASPFRQDPTRPRRSGLLRRFKRREDGASTIAAVLFLPFFIMIMAASVEICVLIFKQTMLDRGVEMTTRVMRLGLDAMPDHEELKRSICNNVAIVSNCMDDLAVEVYSVNRNTWTSTKAGTRALCADGIEEGVNDPTIESGNSDQLMLMRACLKVEPMMSLNPLALALAKDASGKTALITTTAFVNEPRLGGT